ncbi:alpha/beta fold hydrolase [Amycolatopsis sp. NPDC059657]|uniref:alpha/beta fold hydrolase n=1 Tax=Amycolatopsis sp. NPDC059657 TaxID=3346899 RepID=UPI003672E40E
MSRAEVNGIQIEYETLGDPRDPAIILTVGLGAQLIECSDLFCFPLVEAGYFVVRYDNRDAGLSTKCEGRHYSLLDMAGDTICLMDALGIDKAHLVGASMGAMIAQELTIHYPERVRSLCSMISTTGDPLVGRSTKTALRAFGQPPPKNRDEVIEQGLQIWKVVGSPGFCGEEDNVRALVAASYDRSYCPEGRKRQLMAMATAPDRTEGLRGVRVPTLVIHGEADPLIDPSGGRATAAAIPGAEWLPMPDMGHDLPKQTWPVIIAAILRNAAKAH